MRLNMTLSPISSPAIRCLAPLLLLAVSLPAAAQSQPTRVFGLDPGQTSAVDLELHYAFAHANAPPAQCGCFSMNGGGGSLAVNMPHGLSLVADLTAMHANQINATTQNVTVFDYLGGLRYSYRTSSRFTPYAQALLGGSEEFSNLAFITNKTAFAASTGGGLTRSLSRHFAWNLVEADYIYSRLPNANNNRQNDLRISTGIVFRMGPR
jgi:hypothetical protein